MELIKETPKQKELRLARKQMRSERQERLQKAMQRRAEQSAKSPEKTLSKDDLKAVKSWWRGDSADHTTGKVGGIRGKLELGYDPIEILQDAISALFLIVKPSDKEKAKVYAQLDALSSIVYPALGLGGTSPNQIRRRIETLDQALKDYPNEDGKSYIQKMVDANKELLKRQNLEEFNRLQQGLPSLEPVSDKHLDLKK